MSLIQEARGRFAQQGLYETSVLPLSAKNFLNALSQVAFIGPYPARGTVIGTQIKLSSGEIKEVDDRSNTGLDIGQKVIFFSRLKSKTHIELA